MKHFSHLRTLTIATLLCCAQPVWADNHSVCPPVIGDKESMLNNVETLGLNLHNAELCGSPKTQTSVAREKSMAAYRPCLNELGVKATEIDAAYKRGEANAQTTYQQLSPTPGWCDKAKEAAKPIE